MTEDEFVAELDSMRTELSDLASGMNQLEARMNSFAFAELAIRAAREGHSLEKVLPRKSPTQIDDGENCNNSGPLSVNELLMVGFLLFTDSVEDKRAANWTPFND